MSTKEGAISTVTNVDRGILELKSAVTNMHAQVDSLQNKVERLALSSNGYIDTDLHCSLTLRASEALKQKRKAIALNAIRMRKQVQDLLEKRLTALENLENTLLRVEAAAGDIEV